MKQLHFGDFFYLNPLHARFFSLFGLCCSYGGLLRQFNGAHDYSTNNISHTAALIQLLVVAQTVEKRAQISLGVFQRYHLARIKSGFVFSGCETNTKFKQSFFEKVFFVKKNLNRSKQKLTRTNNLLNIFRIRLLFR